MKTVSRVALALAAPPLCVSSALLLAYAHGRRKAARFYNRPGHPRDDGTRLTLEQDKSIGLVAFSAHDSCDTSLGAFASAFGARYRPLRVGEAIEVVSDATEAVDSVAILKIGCGKLRWKGAR